MLIREFEQIKKNNMKLEELYWQYKELKVVGAKAQIYSDMPHGSTCKNSMNDVEESVDIEIKYRTLMLENNRLIMKARKYIKQIPDSTIRQVLEMKYINGMYMFDIAGCLGLTEQECKKILLVHANNVF